MQLRDLAESMHEMMILAGNGDDPTKTDKTVRLRCDQRSHADLPTVDGKIGNIKMIGATNHLDWKFFSQ